jgi:hypothetical protein
VKLRSGEDAWVGLETGILKLMKRLLCTFFALKLIPTCMMLLILLDGIGQSFSESPPESLPESVKA